MEQTWNSWGAAAKCLSDLGNGCLTRTIFMVKPWCQTPESEKPGAGSSLRDRVSP